MKKDVEKDKEGVEIVMIMLAVVWFLSTTLLLVFWKKLPPEMPWFYSLPWGEGQLIGKEGVAIVMGGLGGVIGLDIFFAKRLEKEDEFLAKMLLWGALATAGLVLLSWIKVLIIIL